MPVVFAIALVTGTVTLGVVGGDLGGTSGELMLAAGLVVLLVFLRRRRAARVMPSRAPVDRPRVAETRAGREDSIFDLGIREIRRTDAGFDPRRFAGYAGMLFRDAHSAWMIRDIGSLRDRVTPQMYEELRARSDWLQSKAHAYRVGDIDITAEITEAWQESGRDYVTAYIGGEIVDYTVDEGSGALVSGAKTTPRSVEEFWTFTRPAGLNFWMLSAIQTS